jgi:hypothetical protein
VTVPDRAQLDQHLANLRDNLPAFYWALYTGSVDKGFTAEQAMQIVVAFIQKKE